MAGRCVGLQCGQHITNPDSQCPFRSGHNDCMVSRWQAPHFRESRWHGRRMGHRDLGATHTVQPGDLRSKRWRYQRCLLPGQLAVRLGTRGRCISCGQLRLSAKQREHYSYHESSRFAGRGRWRHCYQPTGLSLEGGDDPHHRRSLSSGKQRNTQHLFGLGRWRQPEPYHHHAGDEHVVYRELLHSVPTDTHGWNYGSQQRSADTGFS